MLKNAFIIILTAICIGWIYHVWLGTGLLAGGDSLFYFPSTYGDFSLYPYVWVYNYVNGFGGFAASIYFYYFFTGIPLFIGNIFHIPWVFLERIFYFFPFLILSFASSMYLLRRISYPLIFQIIGIIIFLTNTYILMLVGGGQIFLGLAYAFLPFVIGFILKHQKTFSLKESIILGLLFSLELAFDLRIFYVGLVCVGILLLSIFIKDRSLKKFIQSIFLIFGIPLFITCLTHSYWILPVLFVHQNPITQLGNAYSSTASVQFFSFAKFENSIGLLHPNWPENIFGKVGFMRLEFLLWPIIAYSALLFISAKKRKEAIFIPYFVCIGLLGAFLAKGSQDPFGGVYLWMFGHVPGFVMFRDPTKWYVLVALSYAVLIPSSLEHVVNNLVTARYFNFLQKRKDMLSCIIVLLFLGIWGFSIRQAVIGEITGTLTVSVVPSEYIKLQQFLLSQKTFSRTLWVPETMQYGFASSTHPAVNGEEFYNTTDMKKVVTTVAKKSTEVQLQDASIGYVIVPDDVQGTIFLTNRKYDEKKYEQVLQAMEKIPWLQRINGFGKIGVFALQNVKEHLWVKNSSTMIGYVKENETSYAVALKNAHKNDTIIFTESYDVNWQAILLGKEINTKPYGAFNSFILPQDGNYSLHIVYTAQRFGDIGLIITLATLITLGGVLIFLFRYSSVK